MPRVTKSQKEAGIKPRPKPTAGRAAASGPSSATRPKPYDGASARSGGASAGLSRDRARPTGQRPGQGRDQGRAQGQGSKPTFAPGGRRPNGAGPGADKGARSRDTAVQDGRKKGFHVGPTNAPRDAYLGKGESVVFHDWGIANISPCIALLEGVGPGSPSIVDIFYASQNHAHPAYSR
jgi:hypothetical protein